MSTRVLHQDDRMSVVLATKADMAELRRRGKAGLAAGDEENFGYYHNWDILSKAHKAGGVWAIKAADGELVGHFCPEADWLDGSSLHQLPFSSIAVFPEHQGRGYATTVARAWMRHLQEDRRAIGCEFDAALAAVPFWRDKLGLVELPRDNSWETPMGRLFEPHIPNFVEEPDTRIVVSLAAPCFLSTKSIECRARIGPDGAWCTLWHDLVVPSAKAGLIRDLGYELKAVDADTGGILFYGNVFDSSCCAGVACGALWLRAFPLRPIGQTVAVGAAPYYMDDDAGRRAYDVHSFGCVVMD